MLDMRIALLLCIPTLVCLMWELLPAFVQRALYIAYRHTIRSGKYNPVLFYQYFRKFARKF